MKRPILVSFIVIGVLAALAAYRTAARDRDYRALLMLGETALNDNDAFAAIDAFSGALVLRPDAMLAHLRRGQAYRQRADPNEADLDRAARDFRLASALDPAATRPLEELGDVLYELRRYDRAVDAYERCLQLDDRSARVAYKLAVARYRTANLDDALTATNVALRLDDSAAEAQYLRGLCLRDARRLSDAASAFERAVSLSPGFIAAREELADLYGALGKRSDELEQLLLISALDRGRPERQVAVGLAHARAGHPDLAVLTLSNALERTPHDEALIYRALGQVWLDIARSTSDSVALSKALAALERVASSPAATSDGLALYGRALLMDGEYAAAERTLQEATNRYPVDPAAFALYADAAAHENHLDAARQALMNAVALAGDDVDFVERAERIAAWSVQLEETDVAFDWLEKASTKRPADLTVLAALADVQLRTGDFDAARATIERGLSKDPENQALLALKRAASDRPRRAGRPRGN